jgi:hypothetical protein
MYLAPLVVHFAHRSSSDTLPNPSSDPPPIVSAPSSLPIAPCSLLLFLSEGSELIITAIAGIETQRPFIEPSGLELIVFVVKAFQDLSFLESY